MDDYMNYINNDVSQIESTFGENRKEWLLDEFMEKYPSDGFGVIPREDLLNKFKAISDEFIKKWVNRVDYGYDGGARFDALHVTSIVTTTAFECGEPTENGGFYYMIDFDDEVNIEYSR